jgi:hypothetical protein
MKIAGRFGKVNTRHMKKRLGIPLFVICSSLVGCTSASDLDRKADRTQSPTADARWLTLIVKAADGVEPQPVTLQYVSEKCKEATSYGVGGQSQSGTAMMRALNFEKIDLVREAAGDAYKARFAIDAGGACQWKLASLETSFKYRSSHRLVKGKEVISHRNEFNFRSAKDSIRTPNVRAEFVYFPVILVKDDPSKNEVRLRPKSLFFPPNLDPSTSGTMTLEVRVFEDMAMTVRAAPQDTHRYLVTYPDGATGTSPYMDMVGVEDARMQCLLSTGKKSCAEYDPRRR